jgi:regulator of extracellular matrix RemA (YlzA/DUF370 family)
VTFLSVGYDNFVVAERIVAIVGCSSAPIRRLIQESRQNGKLLDATQGRRMRSVVLTDSGLLVTSALSQETLVRRASSTRPGEVAEVTEERGGEGAMRSRSP